jgi:hypothetical protein
MAVLKGVQESRVLGFKGNEKKLSGRKDGKPKRKEA